MPNWKISVQGLDPDRTAIAVGRELDVSPKNTREVCNTIKGMKLETAKSYLEDVILMKKPVPFKRYNKKVGHRHGLKRFKFASGRFPEKSARMVYEVLMNAESNAEYKGLDPERLKITHSAVMRGRKIKKYIERAHGRSTPYFRVLTHIEIVLTEI
ncbi:MAG: 50S ribosomal protein L22 [Promethearchaeota archaeon]